MGFFGEQFSASLSLKLLGTIRRNYTHHLETMRVFSGSTETERSAIRTRENWPIAWITRRDFEKYPFSSAHFKISTLVASS